MTLAMVKYEPSAAAGDPLPAEEGGAPGIVFLEARWIELVRNLPLDKFHGVGRCCMNCLYDAEFFNQSYVNGAARAGNARFRAVNERNNCQGFLQQQPPFGCQCR